MNYNTVAISLTHQCPIRCKMCLTCSSIKNKEEMSLEMALDALRQADDINAVNFGISGGEPFLCFEKLREIVRCASRKGLVPVASTNAFWATTLQRSTRILETLKKDGLRVLNVSIDDFHQEFIPIQNVAHVIEAGQRTGFEKVRLACTTTSMNRDIKFYAIYLKEILGADTSGVEIKQGVRIPVGRRKEEFPQCDMKSLEEIGETEKNEVDCFNTLLVAPDGFLYPCCSYFVGPIGDIKKSTIAEILSRVSKNRYFRVLDTGGPVPLVELLEKEGKASLSREKFADKCHVCVKIFEIPELHNLINTEVG